MNSQYLKTFGLASVLVVSSFSYFGSSSAIQAESFPQNPQTILLSQAGENNQFVSVGSKSTNGQIRIIEENGQKYLEFDQSFVTDEGPDLKVILHRDRSVGSRIQEKDYIEIAPLQASSGAQRYLIPEGVDLDQYSSVAIWCRQFNVTFGYAELT